MTRLLRGHSKHRVESAGFLCHVQGEAGTCGEAAVNKMNRKVLGTSLTGLIRGGYLLYRIPICQHFFLKLIAQVQRCGIESYG